MTGNAKSSFGTKFYLVPDGQTITGGLVAEMIKTGKPKISRGMQDVTTHDSAGGAEEVIPEGTYKVEPFTITIHYVANSTIDQALILAMTGGALQDFEIHEKGAAGLIKTPGSGYISDYGPDDAEVRGKQTATFTVTPTGALTAKSAVA